MVSQCYESRLGRLIISLVKPIIAPCNVYPSRLQVLTCLSGLRYLVHFPRGTIDSTFSDLSMNKMIYQHFSKNDSSFIDKGVEWIKKGRRFLFSFLTPFVNPHQEKILKGSGINERHLLHEQSAVS